MPVFYNVVPKANPRAPKSGERKFYAVLKSIGLLDKHDVAKQLAEETTLSPSEAEFALDQFEKVLVRNLLGGYTVKLGELGSFSLTVSSDGYDTPKEVNSEAIKRVNLNFRPTDETKRAINEAKFISLFGS